MPVPPSYVHPQPFPSEVSIAFVGPRPIKERPIAKLKKILKETLDDSKDMWRHSPLEAAFSSSIAVAAIGLGLYSGAMAIDHLGVPEKPGIVQVESQEFVPAHSRIIGGKFVSFNDDAWYETGKIKGQDSTQTVDVEVSRQEFQSDKVGDAIPVVFSKGRFTHALEARRAASASQLPSKDAPALK